MLRDTSTSTGTTTSPEGGAGSSTTGRQTKTATAASASGSQRDQDPALKRGERDERAAIGKKGDSADADRNEQRQPQRDG